MFDHCPTGPLCDRCLADSFAQLRGVAASRGEHWSADVARQLGDSARSREWPQTERSREIARRRVADLTRDPRLLGMLAEEAARYAARWWARRP